MNWRARILGLVVITALAVSYLPPATAHGCSCAWPLDVASLIDETPGSFVGTLREVDRGISGRFGGEAVFRFEVETWVKGGPGQYVDVHSPIGDGGNCGLSDTIGQRVGMFLYVHDGRISSSSCSTVSPEMLLDATTNMRSSSTNIPWMLLGTSSTFSVVDSEGAFITRLDSRTEPGQSAYTGRIGVCPGGDFFVHSTHGLLTIWDATTLQIARRVDVSQISEHWAETVSCRESDASAVLIVLSTSHETMLVEAISGEVLFRVPPGVSGIGATHLTTTDWQSNTVSRFDLATGESTLIFKPPLQGDMQAGYIRVGALPNPQNDTTAVLYTTLLEDTWQYSSTIYIVDRSGEVILEHVLDQEESNTHWSDETALVTLTVSPLGEFVLIALDVQTGEMVSVEGWDGWEILVDGNHVYGVAGTTVLKADVTTGQVVEVARLDSPGATPLLILEGRREITPNQPTVTVPPLNLDETTPSGPIGTSTIARVSFLGVVLAVLGALGVGILRRRRSGSG